MRLALVKRERLADRHSFVDELYSKETRFLYELVQNAEDNFYSEAINNKEDPFLAFQVIPNKVIVDSNENGFSEANIRAICSVGNSTKQHSAGYIGEKGIGFKSVFKIARKVHIQSGPFSFAFSHTRDDNGDGLGLITPYEENYELLPTGVRTRMILTLLDCIQFEELASEFREVPDTILMFLSRLKRLSFDLRSPDDTIIRYSKEEEETKHDGLYTTCLTKITCVGGKETRSEQKYYTMKSELESLPSDEKRVDKNKRPIDSATVILAFPIGPDEEPVIKQQYTYAFLPMGRFGFKFLIQSDFITQASREDITHCTRNDAVLDGVADAFVEAMLVFSKHPSLKYKWMRYLPDNSVSDTFWVKLCHRVRKKLGMTPLLESRSGRGLYKPSDLEKLPPTCFDQEQRPLLPDIKGKEIYLSENYESADYTILQQLGTQDLQWSKFIDRLQVDVKKVGRSKWRNLKADVDWRTRICNVLWTIFDKNLSDQQNRLRTCLLIPSIDGMWVSSSSKSSLYFPKTNQILIPSDLGLNLVSPIAMENNAWYKLLSALGVVKCRQDIVINAIRERYEPKDVVNLSVPNAVAHLRYLYWFLPKEKLSVIPQVLLMNHKGSLLKEHQYMYFPDDRDIYSPSNLFHKNGRFPALPVSYLNDEYLEAVQTELTRDGWSWLRWLEEVLKIRRLPELRNQESDKLSAEFKFLATHRSDKLLETLRRGWSASYQALAVNATQKELQNSAVLLENGTRKPLHETFIPIPHLKRIATELDIAGAYPFISMFEPLRDEDKLQWIFIKDLGVGFEDNLNFYLSALETFKMSHPLPSTSSMKEQLIRIYHEIQSRFTENFDDVR